MNDFSLFHLFPSAASSRSRLKKRLTLQVSYSAHVAGFIAGLLVGMVALRNLKEHRWEVILKWIGFAVFLLLLLIGIIIHIFFAKEVGLYTASVKGSLIEVDDEGITTA